MKLSLLLRGWAFFASGLMCTATPLPQWPTPNPAFNESRSLEAFVQPTASGVATSGCFGCVRKNKHGGGLFHEGLDMLPIKHDKKGNPLDQITPIWPGKVVYINKVGGNSNYGIYVVLEHTDITPAVYTLYGHLNSVETGLNVGQVVNVKDVIGVMGHTSADKIPKARSHLHFEIGLRLSDHFQAWYNKGAFKTGNKHGLWNGMNLVGVDPLDFFETARDGRFKDMSAYLRGLPTAFTLQIATSQVPNFINRYPCVCSAPLPSPGQLKGWEIEFTWYGLPKRWKPLTAEASGSLRDPAIKSYDSVLLKANRCRKTIIFNAKNQPMVGPELKKIIDILFLK